MIFVYGTPGETFCFLNTNEVLHKTKGIVLKTIKFKETSVITKIYTEKFGLQSYIINSVRSPKARHKASYLQPLSLLDLVVYYREHKDLQRVSEIRSSFLFRSIPFHAVKQAVGIFIAEILNKAIIEEESNPPQFDFLYRAIRFLDETSDPVGNYHLWFLLNFSRFLGFYPTDNYQSDRPFFDLQEGIFLKQAPDHVHFISPDLSPSIAELIHTPVEAVHRINLSREERKSLVEHLVRFYQLHLEHFSSLKSTEILTQILAE